MRNMCSVWCEGERSQFVSMRDCVRRIWIIFRKNLSELCPNVLTVFHKYASEARSRRPSAPSKSAFLFIALPVRRRDAAAQTQQTRVCVPNNWCVRARTLTIRNTKGSASRFETTYVIHLQYILDKFVYFWILLVWPDPAFVGVFKPNTPRDHRRHTALRPFPFRLEGNRLRSLATTTQL